MKTHIVRIGNSQGIRTRHFQELCLI
jgi:hypothetical protein